mmetsp:Transcript_32656/g.93725  ORF Transcript_32656/g.93725 Transcript_32656/m.93725 type:complete len:104 (-) Transcript_32656:83-394(-)
MAHHLHLYRRRAVLASSELALRATVAQHQQQQQTLQAFGAAAAAQGGSAPRPAAEDEQRPTTAALGANFGIGQAQPALMQAMLRAATWWRLAPWTLPSRDHSE